MPDDSLKQTLTRLHAELSRSEALDADTRALLEQVLQDIGSLLETSSQEPHTPDSLVERLRQAAADFEDSHPALTAVVGEVADVLSRMGI